MSTEEWNEFGISLLDVSHNFLYTQTSDAQELLRTNFAADNTDETPSSVQCYGLEFCLAYYIEDGAAYDENSDVYVNFLDDSIAPNNYAPTTMTLGANENLDLYPIIGNDGPDAVTNTVILTLQVNGSDLMPVITMPFTSGNTLENGQFRFIKSPSVITITPAELDEAGISGTFRVYLTATYMGIDNNPINNSVCIKITRNTASVNENLVGKLSVYPNPANDMITIANAEGKNLVILNSLGQVVSNINNAAANQTIDLSNYANGTYFVKVNGEVSRFNVIK